MMSTATAGEGESGLLAAARAEVTADEEASKGSKYSEGCFWFLSLAHTSVLDRFPLRLPNPH